ncbi:hypothetical protein BC830DRAFT_699530 [Chytriomyces sp. MP71]|nr:hypothetical protein BC830DRAFT_699530 [Chytriomyces sp. MP71]
MHIRACKATDKRPYNHHVGFLVVGVGRLLQVWQCGQSNVGEAKVIGLHSASNQLYALLLVHLEEGLKHGRSMIQDDSIQATLHSFRIAHNAEAAITVGGVVLDRHNARGPKFLAFVNDGLAAIQVANGEDKGCLLLRKLIRELSRYDHIQLSPSSGLIEMQTCSPMPREDPVSRNTWFCRWRLVAVSLRAFRRMKMKRARSDSASTKAIVMGVQ